MRGMHIVGALLSALTPVALPHRADSGLPPVIPPSGGAGCTEIRIFSQMMESSKDELRQSPNNFFHFSNKEGFKCSSQKMPRSNKSEPYRTPLPALQHILRLLITLLHSPNLPTGNRWNAISISKSFCFSPRSLMPSWSPFLICYLPYAPVTSARSQSVGLLVQPIHLGTAAPQLSVGVHL